MCNQCNNTNNTNNTCGCKTSTNEVVYNGPNLTCTGVNTCDTLSEALQTISTYLCSAEMVQIIVNNIINNTNLYNQFTTIVNTVVDCQTVQDCINQTTTTTTTTIPIECTMFTASYGINTYDPLTNITTQILPGNWFSPANTNNKLWVFGGVPYIYEYDLLYSPTQLVFNRYIQVPNIIGFSGCFAINNSTLIIGALIEGNTNTNVVYELNISSNTAVSTYVGEIDSDFIIQDLLLTTNNKLIIVGNNVDTSISKVWQYNYLTWELEVEINITDQLLTETIVRGISEYNNEIYLFGRINSCNIGTPSGIYTLNPITYELTYIDQTGYSCPLGASTAFSCNTVDLIPGITTTTTSTSSTTTTTTTIAPTGINTIYTYFNIY